MGVRKEWDMIELVIFATLVVAIAVVFAEAAVAKGCAVVERQVGNLERSACSRGQELPKEENTDELGGQKKVGR